MSEQLDKVDKCSWMYFDDGKTTDDYRDWYIVDVFSPTPFGRATLDAVTERMREACASGGDDRGVFATCEDGEGITLIAIDPVAIEAALAAIMEAVAIKPRLLDQIAERQYRSYLHDAICDELDTLDSVWDRLRFCLHHGIPLKCVTENTFDDEALDAMAAYLNKAYGSFKL